ncbi:MAG: hypothetical protein NTX56_05655 [Proteobacteria bacterium]|nr:hypothetical protein [Pseudomonadota bacterium]
MNPALIADTLGMLKGDIRAAFGAPVDEMAKAWTQSNSAVSGITAYDLEAPSKKLYPVITPLRNEIPRVSGKGGIQAAWRAVTGINTGSMLPYVSGGNRSGVITTSTADYTAAYKGLGLEDSVTFEADYASENFEDTKALAVEGLLRAMMIAEEKVILGGNNSMSLGNIGGIVATSANTGGSLVYSSNYGVGCVALTFEGYLLASVTGGIVQSTTRSNADSSSDVINGGTGLPATQANVTTSATGSTSTCSISASVSPVAGAVAYAWYAGANATSNLGIVAITTINSVLITANSTANMSIAGCNYASLGATNNSKNSLAFDGLLTFASQSSLNSYQYTMANGTAGTGTTLTADGAGGVVEIDAVLKSLWDNYRLSPDTMWMNSQESENVGKKILSGTSTGAQRFVFNADPTKIAGGIKVVSYWNKFGMNGASDVQIRIHPNMPPGTILFTTKTLPYPLSNVTNVMQMRMRRDYYQIEWPLVTRKYQYGVYEDGVLQHYFPPSLALITNIANG